MEQKLTKVRNKGTRYLLKDYSHQHKIHCSVISICDSTSVLEFYFGNLCHESGGFPASIYLLKVNNRNARRKIFKVNVQGK